MFRARFSLTSFDGYGFNGRMLGRLRRTTRTDVGLALTMAGFVYLAWVLACYVAKTCARGLAAAYEGASPGGLRAAVATLFGRYAAVFDLLGPVTLCLSLWLVIRASRQRRIISWSWLVISCQAIAAILVAVAAAGATAMAFAERAALTGLPPADWSPVIVAIAVLVWVSTLVWLIFERIKLGRGPTLGDGTRTHMFRR